MTTAINILFKIGSYKDSHKFIPGIRSYLENILSLWVEFICYKAQS